jgi:glutamate/aspartate transport system substrate-binding protein
MRRNFLIGLTLAAALGVGAAQAEDLTGTLKNIKETGAITLGYRDSSIPFSYLDDNQKPIGYAMDICYKIVDAVKKELKLDKLEVKLNPVTSSTRIPLLANGTIDLECGSTTNNADRLKQVSFTNTHFLTATRYVSKKSSKLNSIEDLKGKSVVSTSGTTNIKQLTEANARARAQRSTSSGQGPCRSLLDGRDRPRGRLRDGRHLCWQASSPARRRRMNTSSPRTRSPSPSPTASLLRKDASGLQKVSRCATAALYTGGEGQKIYANGSRKVPPKMVSTSTCRSAPELKNEFRSFPTRRIRIPLGGPALSFAEGRNPSPRSSRGEE